MLFGIIDNSETIERGDTACSGFLRNVSERIEEETMRTKCSPSQCRTNHTICWRG